MAVAWHISNDWWCDIKSIRKSFAIHIDSLPFPSSSSLLSSSGMDSWAESGKPSTHWFTQLAYRNHSLLLLAGLVGSLLGCKEQSCLCGNCRVLCVSHRPKTFMWQQWQRTIPPPLALFLIRRSDNDTCILKYTFRKIDTHPFRWRTECLAEGLGRRSSK